MRRTRSIVSCTAGILPSAHGFKDRGLDQVGLWLLSWLCLARHPRFQAATSRGFACDLYRLFASLAQVSRNVSISPGVVEKPRLSRMAPRENSAGTPIAASTWDGATFPDEHAEPDDTAIPARSSAIRAVSAFM